MAAANQAAAATDKDETGSFGDDSSDEEFISIKRMYSVSDEQAEPARKGTVSASAPALAPQQEEKDDDGAENVYERHRHHLHEAG